MLCFPTIQLDRYLRIIKKVYYSGADIFELNRVRKKYSRVKEGKLARMTKAHIVSIISSDVVGDDLSTIASGPTYAKGLRNVDNIMLLNNEVALKAMIDKALSLGLKPIVVTSTLKGEAMHAGKGLLKQVKEYSGKNCFVFGGETTVNVASKTKGKGGRNQVLCLAAIKELSKLKNATFVSIDSDGIDGNTDAAGAMVSTSTFKDSFDKGLDYLQFLNRNDSYRFHKRMKALVFTGATGSNVSDIGLILI